MNTVNNRVLLLPTHNWIWLQRIFIYKAKQLTHGWLRLISKEHCATTYFAQCQPTTHACMSEESKLIHEPKTRLVEGCIWANMHFHFLTLGFYNCQVCVMQPTPMKRTTPCPSLQSKHLQWFFFRIHQSYILIVLILVSVSVNLTDGSCREGNEWDALWWICTMDSTTGGCKQATSYVQKVDTNFGGKLGSRIRQNLIVDSGQPNSTAPTPRAMSYRCVVNNSKV